ncbi:hypothetical protein H8D30_00745 [bacterium]|nr:hypothetical protein [bacterium]
MTVKGWILIILVVGVALALASSAAAGFKPSGGGDAILILGGSLLVIIVIMAIYWKEGAGRDRSRMPRIRTSASLNRHTLRKEHIMLSFRSWVASPSGTLPPCPKLATHDEEFSSCWARGDLEGCYTRLDELLEENRDPSSPEHTMTLLYMRTLERMEKEVMTTFPQLGSEGSIFDETD